MESVLRYIRAVLAVCVLGSSVLFASTPKSQIQSSTASRGPLCFLNSNLAIRLRNELLQNAISTKRGLEIRATLEDTSKRCSGSLNPADVEILGGLYVLLGNRLFQNSDYIHAEGVFQAADRLFSRAAVPSFMWLEALKGAVKADLRSGHTEVANGLASRQTALARDWVRSHRLDKSALVSALRFQAEVYSAEGKLNDAKAVLLEAEKVQSTS